MKLYLLVFILLAFSSNGQSIEKLKFELLKIQTLPEAHEYIRNNENLKGELLYLKTGVDTTALDVELLASSKGDLIDFDSDDEKVHFFYKTIETKYVNSYRLQYIFLDNRKLTDGQIDSIRAVILKRISNGEHFDNLAREYSMDVNAKNGGDRGWFEEGRMHADIENNIKHRKLDEVYTVDIPFHKLMEGVNIADMPPIKWYYVIKNTHAPRVDKKVTILYVEINN